MSEPSITCINPRPGPSSKVKREDVDEECSNREEIDLCTSDGEEPPAEATEDERIIAQVLKLPEKVMTHQSINDCSKKIKDFLLKKGKSSRFTQLFTDIWKIISHEQKWKNKAINDLAWKRLHCTKGLDNYYFLEPKHSGNTKPHKSKESVVKKIFDICTRENCEDFKGVDKKIMKDFGERLMKVTVRDEPGTDFENVDHNQRKRPRTDFYAPPDSIHGNSTRGNGGDERRKETMSTKGKRQRLETSSSTNATHHAQRNNTNPSTLKDILRSKYLDRTHNRAEGSFISCKRCHKKSSQSKLNVTTWCDHIVCDCPGCSLDEKYQLASKCKSKRCGEWLQGHPFDDHDKNTNEEESEDELHCEDSSLSATSSFAQERPRPQSNGRRGVSQDRATPTGMGVSAVGVKFQEVKHKVFFIEFQYICGKYLIDNEIFNAEQEFSIDCRGKNNDFKSNLRRLRNSEEEMQEIDAKLNEVGLQLKRITSEYIYLRKRDC